MTQEIFRVVVVEPDGKIPDNCFPAILQYDHPKVVWLQPVSQQPIPQDIKTALFDKLIIPLKFGCEETCNCHAECTKAEEIIEEVAQILLPQLQQLREENENLKDNWASDQALLDGYRKSEELLQQQKDEWVATCIKRQEIIEQQKSQIEELKKQVANAFVEKHSAIAMQKQKTGLQWIEQAAEIESLKQELTEANGILRSCNSIIERRGEKTNWLAIEYKVKERLKKQHEILKQQTHG